MRKDLLLAPALLLAVGIANAGAPPKKPEPAKAPVAAPAKPVEIPKGEMAHAEIKGADGKSMGMATLEETPHGVLITAMTPVGVATDDNSLNRLSFNSSAGTLDAPCSNV